MSTSLSVEGIVKETLPALEFLIESEEYEHTILAHLAGKMRIHRIRVVTGDKVVVELAPDRRRGRIVRRL